MKKQKLPRKLKKRFKKDISHVSYILDMIKSSENYHKIDFFNEKN